MTLMQRLKGLTLKVLNQSRNRLIMIMKLLLFQVKKIQKKEDKVAGAERRQDRRLRRSPSAPYLILATFRQQNIIIGGDYQLIIM